MRMKICHLFTTAFLVFLSGEAFAQQAYEKGKPGDSNYEYLNSYGALKDYIDCTKYPNFKLGVGTTASEYIKKGTEFKRNNANFTEVVTGNAMKYASNVKNDGSMDFTTVRNFVKAASDVCCTCRKYAQQVVLRASASICSEPYSYYG